MAQAARLTFQTYITKLWTTLKVNLLTDWTKSKMIPTKKHHRSSGQNYLINLVKNWMLMHSACFCGEGLEPCRHQPHSALWKTCQLNWGYEARSAKACWYMYSEHLHKIKRVLNDI